MKKLIWELWLLVGKIMELVSIEVTQGKIAEMLFLMTLIHIYPRGSGFEFGKDKTTQSSCWSHWGAAGLVAVLGMPGPPQASSLDCSTGAPVLNLPCSWRLESGFSQAQFEMICESSFPQYLGAFVACLGVQDSPDCRVSETVHVFNVIIYHLHSQKHMWYFKSWMWLWNEILSNYCFSQWWPFSLSFIFLTWLV